MESQISQIYSNLAKSISKFHTFCRLHQPQVPVVIFMIIPSTEIWQKKPAPTLSFEEPARANNIYKLRGRSRNVRACYSASPFTSPPRRRCTSIRIRCSLPLRGGSACPTDSGCPSVRRAYVSRCRSYFVSLK